MLRKDILRPHVNKISTNSNENKYLFRQFTNFFGPVVEFYDKKEEFSA